MEPRYHHRIIGINSRLDSFQAAILNVKIKYLEGWTMMRVQNARRYNEMFLDAGLENTIGIPQPLPNRRHVWNQYTIRVLEGQRDDLRKNLAERKIGAEIYYPFGLHEQECFKYLGYNPESLPETYRASREVLSLPIFPELTENEQQVVVRNIKSYFDLNSARHVFPATTVTPVRKRDAA
jgi:dTDP-4-amino-4,6-dideoxygalactose transaminase